MKTCTKCGLEKPRTEFYSRKENKDGLRRDCKTCVRERSGKRYSENSVSINDKNRWYYLRKTYGLTRERYEEMNARQEGKCAICGTTDPGGNSNGFMLVDHEHETGEVRALLCHHCNAGIGHLGEDPDRLLAAAAYLLQYQNVLGAK